MTRKVRAEGPGCPSCGAASYRAVRIHRAADSERCYIISIRWACSQCGLRFTDASLDEFNERGRVVIAGQEPHPSICTARTELQAASDVA